MRIVKSVVGATLNCINDLRLTDDFYTTGATALECRKALMHAEPADVIFIAFAAKY